VVDFISVGPWPNFNVADAAITLGVSVWLWSWLRSEVAWGATRIIDQEG
jgi:lipoprotein signal peptidase